MTDERERRWSVTAATGEGAAVRPWYREGWVWGIIAGPAAVVLAGVVTIALAVQSDDGVVAEDYYKRGLAINRVLEREARARELGLEADVSFAGERVRVVLGGEGVQPPSLVLRVVHPTRSNADDTAVLVPRGARLYEGVLQKAIATHGAGSGLILVLEDAGAQWRLGGRLAPDGMSVRLAARPQD